MSSIMEYSESSPNKFTTFCIRYRTSQQGSNAFTLYRSMKGNAIKILRMICTKENFIGIRDQNIFPVTSSESVNFFENFYIRTSAGIWFVRVDFFKQNVSCIDFCLIKFECQETVFKSVCLFYLINYGILVKTICDKSSLNVIVPSS